jgi:patatin-like phospholipase/acyl hydrolase
MLASNSSSSTAGDKTFRVLCLDGGGAKGTYTIGLLQQVEALAGKPLYQCFDLIYGTSTGAIIASMLGLGYTVSEIYAEYMRHVPAIMRQFLPSQKSAALKRLTTEVFQDKTFKDFKTHVGVVATNWNLERPLVFKSTVEAAYGSKCTFTPGFGCTIGEAVCASSAAAPFFKRVFVKTENQGTIEAADGGFFANNPTLLAITDALGSFKHSPENIKVLSVGCGRFPERKRNFIWRMVKRTPTAQVLQKVLSTSSVTIEHQCKFLFPKIEQIRINEGYESPEFATDFLEAESKKLEKLYQRGRQSFEAFEENINRFFK